MAPKNLVTIRTLLHYHHIVNTIQNIFFKDRQHRLHLKSLQCVLVKLEIRIYETKTHSRLLLSDDNYLQCYKSIHKLDYHMPHPFCSTYAIILSYILNNFIFIWKVDPVYFCQ